MPYKYNAITGRFDLVNSSSSGSGDVVGPASSTDNSIAIFDGATGKLLQDSSSVGAPDITMAGGFYWDSVNGRLSLRDADHAVTINGVSVDAVLALHAEGATDLGEVIFERHSDTAGLGGHLVLTRSRGTEASPTVVQNGDILGRLLTAGWDGTDYAEGAEIAFAVDGTPGSNDMPTRIDFYTSSDGSQTPTLRGSFRANGAFQASVFTYPTADGTAQFPVVTDGSGVLSIDQIVPAAIEFASGTEGRVPFVNNSSPTNGLATDSTFLFNSTLKGIRFGPGLTDTYTAYTITFLSRFWAVSVSGFLATFILEHRESGPAGFPTFILGKTNGTLASRSNVADGDGLGAMYYQGYHTGTFANGGSIQVSVDGTPGFLSVPGRMQLQVTEVGGTLSTTAIDIRSSLAVTIAGGVTINENSLDQDTRIEGNTNANLFFVDAGTDRVGINTNAPTVLFDVIGASSLNGATVVNEAGADADFRVEGDTNQNLIFADASTDRVGIGTSTPSVLFNVNGSSSLDGATVINEAGADVDTRAEGDTDINLLFVNAGLDQVSIGTDSGVSGIKHQVNGLSAVKYGSVSTTTDIVMVGGSSDVQVSTAGVGNVGTGEDDLLTYTLPASALGTDGDYIEITGFGTFAANANNKRVRVYFGATAILDTTALPLNGGTWNFRSKVFRTGAATQQTETMWLKSGSGAAILVNIASPTETLSSTVVVKVTGEATSNNNIVQRSLVVKWYPNA